MLRAATLTPWTKEEEEFLFSEWKAWEEKHGRKKLAFLRHLHPAMPQRTFHALKSHLARVTVKKGGRLCRLNAHQPLQLSVADCGYLAAIFDGEGTMSKPIHVRTKEGGYGAGCIINFVIVTNTNVAVIDKVKRILSPVVSVHKVNPRNKGWKPLYAVYVRGFRAMADVISQILPYMAHSEKISKCQENLAWLRARIAKHDHGTL